MSPSDLVGTDHRCALFKRSLLLILWPNAGSMVGQRLRRCPTIEPALGWRDAVSIIIRHSCPTAPSKPWEICCSRSRAGAARRLKRGGGHVSISNYSHLGVSLFEMETFLHNHICYLEFKNIGKLSSWWCKYKNPTLLVLGIVDFWMNSKSAIPMYAAEHSVMMQLM